MAEKRYLIRPSEKVAVIDVETLAHLIERIRVTKKNLERSKGRLQMVAALVKDAVIEFGDGVELIRASFFKKVKEIRKIEPSFGEKDRWVAELGQRIQGMQQARHSTAEQKPDDSEFH